MGPKKAGVKRPQTPAKPPPEEKEDKQKPNKIAEPARPPPTPKKPEPKLSPAHIITEKLSVTSPFVHAKAGNFSSASEFLKAVIQK